MPHRNYIYIGIKSFPFKNALFCGHGQTESSEYSTVLKSIDMVVGDVASCNVPEKFNFICGVVGDKNKPILMAGPRHGKSYTDILNLNDSSHLYSKGTKVVH